MLGTIAIEGIEVFGYHGVYPVEKRQGTHFQVDVYLKVSFEEIGLSDELVKTVDYQAVYEQVLSIMSEPVDLLETLCNRMGAEIMSSNEAIEGVKVKVSKLKPLGMPYCRLTYVEREFLRDN